MRWRGDPEGRAPSLRPQFPRKDGVLPSFVALFLATLESCLGCSGAYAAAVTAALRSAGESLASEGPNGSGGGRAMGKTEKLGFIRQPAPEDC